MLKVSVSLFKIRKNANYNIAFFFVNHLKRKLKHNLFHYELIKVIIILIIKAVSSMKKFIINKCMNYIKKRTSYNETKLKEILDSENTRRLDDRSGCIVDYDSLRSQIDELYNQVISDRG